MYRILLDICKIINNSIVKTINIVSLFYDNILLLLLCFTFIFISTIITNLLCLEIFFIVIPNGILDITF